MGCGYLTESPEGTKHHELRETVYAKREHLVRQSSSLASLELHIDVGLGWSEISLWCISSLPYLYMFLAIVGTGLHDWCCLATDQIKYWENVTVHSPLCSAFRRNVSSGICISWKVESHKCGSTNGRTYNSCTMKSGGLDTWFKLYFKGAHTPPVPYSWLSSGKLPTPHVSNWWAKVVLHQTRLGHPVESQLQSKTIQLAIKEQQKASNHFY